VRGVNWLGDAVMTTPALQRLRERLPDAEITLLTHEKLSGLWENHPALNAVITFGTVESLRSIARRLRDLSFEMAIILPNSPRSALEAWLARIPQRVGYAWSWRNLFLTQAIPARPDRVKMRKRSIHEIKKLTLSGRQEGQRINPASHQIHEYLHLAAALGANPEPVAPELKVTAGEVKEAEEKILPVIARKLPGISGTPILLGLNPGAEYGPAKRWAAENFAAVIREVTRRQSNCVWIAFGGPNDARVCQNIERAAAGKILNLAGKTSLRELMASLKLCRLLLTNDSGPMHVAAALGTPVVVPFGSTSPELTGPGFPGDAGHRLLKSGAPCAPCFRRVCPIDFRCMTGITPNTVTDEVLKMIEGARG
jgi:heptosyltransferase-2